MFYSSLGKEAVGKAANLDAALVARARVNKHNRLEVVTFVVVLKIEHMVASLDSVVVEAQQF